jgi:O-antigen/teichoic acid export membrane protein
MLKVILSIGAIQAVAIVIQFVRSKVVAVTLGPAGVGVVSTIDQTVQFVAFAAAFSIPLASVKFLSKAHSEGHEAFKRCYAGFFQLLGLLASAGTGLVAGLIFLRPGIFGAEIEKYHVYLLVALLSLPTLILGGFFSNVFAAAQNYRASAALAIITNAVTTIAVIAGIFADGIFGLFIGGSLASIAVTLGITAYLWKRLDLPFFADGTKNLKELWQSPNIISFTAMLYFGSVSYSLSLLVARYAILANFGETETGLLQGALVLSVAIGMVLNPANGLYLTPIMNRNIEKVEKIRRAAEFQRKMAIILCLVSLPAVMFPQLLLAIMFSTKFASVGNLVFLFIFAQFVTQMAGVHQAVLIGFDDLKIYTAIVTGGQIGYAVLAWFLAPHYGIKGIALGSVISSLAIFSLTFIRLKIKHGFSAPRNLSLLIGYGLFILLMTGWICNQINEWDITVSVLKVGFFALFAASLLLFLSKEERFALYELRNKISFGR